MEEVKLSKNNDDKSCTHYSIVLRRGHIKISKCHSHSAGLFDYDFTKDIQNQSFSFQEDLFDIVN